MRGVCNVGENEVQCWDLRQNHDDDLAKQVSTMLSSSQAQKSELRASVPMHFRRKNRIAVFQVASTYGHNETDARFDGFQTLDSEGVQALDRYDQTADPIETKCVPIDVDRAEGSTSLFANLKCMPGPTVEIPLQKGAFVTVGQYKVTINSIELNQPNTYLMAAPGRPLFGPADTQQWDIHFGVEGPGSHHQMTADIMPLDNTGQPIRMLDMSGKPYHMPTMRPKPLTGNPLRTPNYHPVRLGMPGTFEPMIGEIVTKLYVDPRVVSKLKLTVRDARVIEFKDIPLDPKN